MWFRLLMSIKRKYKIVASDLDGTLLGNDQTVSEENLSAIEEMHRRGVEFVPTTGRALNEIAPALIDSPAIRYIITSDGAAIWDKQEKKMILTRYFPAEVVHFILDTLKEHTVFIVAHEDGKTYYDKEKYTEAFLNKCRIDSYFGEIIGRHAEGKSDFEAFLRNSEKVEMLALFFELDASIFACKQVFEESGRLFAMRSAKNNLEVCLSEAGKGKTLKALARLLSVDTMDVIAVGDSDNDSTLIEAAGLGLAMGNACDALKALADQTICDNSEHIAEYVLENFIEEN